MSDHNLPDLKQRVDASADQMLSQPPAKRASKNKTISFLREFLLYVGPALIVSVAYMDPGNYGTDLSAGAAFRFDLVWAVWLASGMAMVLQYLSGKLGIASGRSLPELIGESLRSKSFTVPFWLGSELAAAATDLAEYLGTVLALNLLFGVPLLYAAIFGALDVILILTMMSRRFRVIEQYFMILVSVLVFGVLFQVFVVRPNLGQVAYHSVVPLAPSSDAVLLVVGIIGATVMPHALFVHSWLTKNKVVEGTRDEKVKKRKFHLTETVTLLTVAAVVNVGLLLVATPFYPNPNITIQSAYRSFISSYGQLVGIIFVLAMLASGLSSSTTGTIAGQVIMEGLIGKKWNIWARRVVTRIVNVFPTTMAILLGLNPLGLLVYSQVILSLMLPLPMIPLVYYTSRRKLMGEFVNSSPTTVLAVASTVVIIAFNVYLLLSLA